MDFKVRVFAEGKEIPSDKLNTVVINSKSVNMIVNSITERDNDIVRPITQAS